MPRKKKLTNEQVQNGLAYALGLPSNNFFGPGAGGNPYSPQISQTNTIFENLRWYLISNFRQPLSEAYLEIGLIQTVIDTPVDDGLRGGVEINTSELGENEIKELQIGLDRDRDYQTLGHAGKWNRLFGGAGIVVIVGDQDPEEPLDIKAITSNTTLEFKAADIWELFPDDQNLEGYDTIDQSEEFTHYNYYGTRIHKSRVIKLMNRMPPSFLRPRLRGWGYSEVEFMVRSVNQYLKATDVGFSCLDEFKIDVYGIKDLANILMSPNGDQLVRQRIQTASASKNYQNAIVLDSEDNYQQKQISFAGLAETMQGIRMQVAADMHFPITKLFGTSASGGIGNNDQNDMENYNSMVEGQVREKLKYPLLRMLELKSQHRYGIVPKDLEIKFKQLRVLSATDEENVKTAQLNRLIQVLQVNEISSKNFKNAINKANLLPVQVDATVNNITEDTAEEEISNAASKFVSKKESHDWSQIIDDAWIILNPNKVDMETWKTAKKIVEKEYGEILWPIVNKIYQALGGTFS